MARIKVRYLIQKPGRNGPRYFWQPSKALRAQGWHPVRLSDDRDQAIAEAEARNKELDAWREGRAAAAAAPAPAIGKRNGPAPGTVDALIAEYKASRFYQNLKPKSKRGYDQCLAIISEWAGDQPARAITERMVQDFYEPLFERTPAYANATMRVARVLFECGRRFGYLTRNVFVRPGLVGTAFTGKLWPREAVAAIVETADRLGYHSIGTAVMLDEWIGQREADVLNLPRTIRRADGLKVLQSKTGAGVDLPIGMVAQLMERIDAELARQAARDVTSTKLITFEKTGQPYTEDQFRHTFALVRDTAALKYPQFETDYIVRGRDPDAEDARIVRMTELKFFHLRHTAVVRLAEAGCELPLISAITGHSLSTVKQILERYLIRTGEMARQAFAKRLEHERRQKEG